LKRGGGGRGATNEGEEGGGISQILLLIKPDMQRGRRGRRKEIRKKEKINLLTS
jgi:hypothetical protein